MFYWNKTTEDRNSKLMLQYMKWPLKRKGNRSGIKWKLYIKKIKVATQYLLLSSHLQINSFNNSVFGCLKYFSWVFIAISRNYTFKPKYRSCLIQFSKRILEEIILFYLHHTFLVYFYSHDDLIPDNGTWENCHPNLSFSTSIKCRVASNNHVSLKITFMLF